VPFPAKPRMESMTYPIFRPDGTQTGTFTAAEVLSWRAKTVKSRSARLILGRTRGGSPDRGIFQQFLRASFRRLLSGSEEEVSALVSAITPHSFRAGLASDLFRQGVAKEAIMMIGRCQSERAMKQYVRDSLAQRLSSASFRSLRSVIRAMARQIRKARKTQKPL